ncbi:MAG: GIN domain-containing protein [Fidelibacterota bacterium]|mgnify:FL=1|jgi:hypothetical protein|nr:DUF2807 domain-containing protein [Candidatus Neomarinimicrobiota bacterium]|tara:strand:+ start:2722 stop:3369 length:648 start_codon:yes stop_codon:yes gene_type:complete
MKKRILAISLLLTIVSNVYAEPYEIKLNEFNSISNTTPFDIEIRFSDRTYAEINLNEKSESYLKIRIEDNRLIIESVKDDWWKFWNKISLRGTIYIYTQSSKFKFIENIGTGSMNFSDKISSNSLQVNLIGTGSILFSGGGEVFNNNINVTGTGNVNMEMIQVNIAEAKVLGTGNIKIDVIEELKVTIVGTGSVIYKGRPKISSEITGTGRLIST